MVTTNKSPAIGALKAAARPAAAAYGKDRSPSARTEPSNSSYVFLFNSNYNFEVLLYFQFIECVPVFFIYIYFFYILY